MADAILLELWKIKDELAARHKYDIHTLASYLRLKERERRAQSKTERPIGATDARGR